MRMQSIKNNHKKIKKTKFYIYFILTIASLIYAFSIQSFIFVSRILPSGLTSISTLFAIVIPSLGPYISLIYLILNIPFIIIMWKKIDKTFLYRTIYFLFAQALFSSIFIIKSINKEIVSIIVNRDETFEKIWPIFLLSIIGACFNGFSYSLTWKFGGSNGGSNFITYYVSQKKEKSLGNISFIISISFAFFSFIIALLLRKEFRQNAVPILLSNILYIGITSSIINSLYPRFEKVRVEVHSDKLDEINKMLKKEYTHSWKIIDFESGFTNQRKKYISTTMLLLEFNSFKNKIKKIDPSVWISVSKSIRVIGQFNSNIKIK